MEQFKTDLDNVKHAKQQQFDNEYFIYQELCAKFYQMICDVHWLYPEGLDRAPAIYDDEEGLKEICNERYKASQKSYNEAVSFLGSKAPFMNENLYEQYMDIIKLCARQIHYYSFANPTTKHPEQVRKLMDEGFKATPEIDKKWNALITELRTYCKNMK